MPPGVAVSRSGGVRRVWDPVLPATVSLARMYALARGRRTHRRAPVCMRAANFVIRHQAVVNQETTRTSRR
jgi:hypothetical protein